jgi:tRNA(Ile)-lysidine synthase
MALLHALLSSSRENLIVAHLDHRLRGRASTADAAFVRKQATALGLPVFTGRADTRAYAAARGISLELAARELRHTFFAAAARAHRSNHIVLAHHSDDQIETILHNFLRGTGPTGLTGMQPVSPLQVDRRTLTLHRPLLAVRRADLDAYISDHQIPYREDASNTDPAHTRNRLRHDLIPLIERTFGPAFTEAALRNAVILRAEDEHLSAETDAIPISAKLPVATLRDLPLALRRRVIRRWLTLHAIPHGLAEIDRVLTLLDPTGPAKINLPADRHARRRAGSLFVEP